MNGNRSHRAVLTFSTVFGLCLALPLGAEDGPPVQRAAEPSRPQRLQIPRAARAELPANPQVYVNRKQAHLRDHHLVKTPPVRLSPRVARIADVSRGPETELAPMADSPVEILVNHPLNDSETGGLTSTVGEPSVASSSGNHVLMTGNWYAAFSDDGGNSFQFVNPNETFPETDTHSFCCDQVAIYSPDHDLLMWFLQYTQDGHSNIVRLAVAQGEDIGNQNWQHYDFSPQGVGGWSDEWFDFPDLALNSDHVYISTNSFATQGTTNSNDDDFARAVALRLPLDRLANYEPVTADFFQTEEAFSLRPTHGAGVGTMHFGSHDFADFGGGILVYSWSEDDDSVELLHVDVAPWSNAARLSECKDGRQWLTRCDFRMTAAWADGAQAGFAWTAAQDESFDHPHVRVAIIDTASGDLLAEPHLWNSGFAYAYPYTAPNSDGDIGVSVCFGGGGEEGFNVSHAVGVLRETAESHYEWRLATTQNGTNGPEGGRWGDYLAVRPHGADGTSWIASGFTLDGGPLAQNVVPRFVHFRLKSPTEDRPAPGLSGLRQELVGIREQIDAAIRRIDELQPQDGGEADRPKRRSPRPRRETERRR